MPVAAILACFGSTALLAQTPDSASPAPENREPSPTPVEPPPAEVPETAEVESEAEVDELDADPGPGKAKPGLFHLNRLDGYVELGGSVEQSRVRNRANDYWSGSRQTNRDTQFDETLGLSFDLDMVDPALLQFSGDVEFGLRQSTFREKTEFYDEEDHDDTYLTTYDLQLDLLQGKPVSGTIYGRRSEDRIARRFQPSLQEDRTEWGTNWVYKSDKFPMRLNYFHRETDRTENRDSFDNEHLIERGLRWEGDWIINENQTLKLAYEFGDQEQDYQGSNFEYDTSHHEFSLDYELLFGDDKQHEFSVYARAREEDGDLARDTFEFQPQLTLKHSDTLSTRYTYQYYQENLDYISTDTHRADFQLVHQMYTNLTSTYNVFALYEKTEDDLQTTQWGGGADWQYNRRNDWGHFRGHLSYEFDTAEYEGDNGLRYINNESGVFRDPRGITLSQRDVIPGSIIITNAANTVVYTPVQDYVFRTIGDRVVLTRNPTGRIADGDTVLIDYLYRTPADGNLDTHRVNFGVSQEFAGGWTPYYDFQFRAQEVDESTGTPLEEDRLNRHRAGLRYRKDRWGASGEFEWFDDSIEPYTAFHLRGNYDILREAAHTVDASADFSRYYFTRDEDFEDREVSLLDISLNHRYSISQKLSWRAATAYRYEDDSIDGITHGVDVEAGFQYELGELTVDLSAEYDLLDIEEDDEDGFGVWLKVRRDFGNLLPGIVK